MAEPDFSDVFSEDSPKSEEPASAAADALCEEGNQNPSRQGEKEQEVTEPVDEREGQQPKEQKDAAKAAKPQDQEENTKYAAARRKAERERDLMVGEARQKAAEASEREVDEIFANAGLVNPYTGVEIKTKADFVQWQKQYDEDQRDVIEDELRESGLSVDEVNHLLANHPDVVAARSKEQKADAALAKTTKERMELKVEKELSRIRQWDGEVKSLNEITQAENFPEIYEKVKRGYALADAYYLVNAQRFQDQNLKRAEQAMRNHLQGKEHLTGTNPRGSGETGIPTDIMAEFRRLMPKASGEEIRKFYQRDRAHLKH